MKEIQLTQGQVTLVDDCDYESLLKHVWHTHNNGAGLLYAVRMLNGSPHYMHRTILNAQRGQYVDHRNKDTLNNQKSNLRLCKQFENCRNRGAQVNSQSGTKGVYFEARRNRWLAQITISGKPNRVTKHLGYFIDFNQAVRAYRNAAEIYFGEYAPNGNNS